VVQVETGHREPYSYMAGKKR